VDASPPALAGLVASAFVVVACLAAPLSSASCARRQISVFSCAESTAKLHQRCRILQRHVDGALQIDGRVRIILQHLVRVAARLERIDVAGEAFIIGVASSTSHCDASNVLSRSMRCSRSSGNPDRSARPRKTSLQATRTPTLSPRRYGLVFFIGTHRGDLT
jgi:hypothetical protein